MIPNPRSFVDELTKIAIVVVLPPGTADAAVRLMRKHPRLAMGAGGAVVGGMVGDDDKTLSSALAGGALAAHIGPRLQNESYAHSVKLTKAHAERLALRRHEVLKNPTASLDDFRKVKKELTDWNDLAPTVHRNAFQAGGVTAAVGGGAVGGLAASALGRAVNNYNDPMYQDKTAGPFDSYVPVPQRQEFDRSKVSRTGYVEMKRVPDELQPARTKSEAPRTVGMFDQQSKALKTQRVEDNRPAPWAPKPAPMTRIPQASTPSPPMVAGGAPRTRKPA